MPFDILSTPRLYTKIYFACLIIICLTFISSHAFAEPQKLITLGGPVTEIVYALEAGDQVVATDTTSKYPLSVLELPKVGYMRQLSAEGLLSLNPDMIIALEGSGPVHVLDTLKSAGIKIIMVPELTTPAAITTGIDLVATELNKVAIGQNLSTAIEEQLHSQYALVEKKDDKPTVLFLLNTGHGGPMTAGRGTAIDTIITYAGATNIASDLSNFKPLASEYIVGHNPDYLLMSERSLNQSGGAAALAKDPLLGKLTAVQEGKILTLDGTLLFGLGPRTSEAVDLLSQQLSSVQN